MGGGKMMLSESHLKSLLNSNPPLIENLIDPNKQIQPAGVDLSLSEVHSIHGSGKVDFDNSERELPKTQPLQFENDWLYLDPGIYKVIYNEIVHMPKNVVAIARTRSTLIRMGAQIVTAVWDPGYHGRSESLLVVHNPEGIYLKKNARIVQLIFFQLEEQTSGYSGRYLGENI